MRNILVSVLAVAAANSIANAETLQFQLYQVNPENRTNRTGDFFQDYIFTSQCVVKIADSALQPNAFIDITSSDFESFQCSVEGNDNTYSFDAGAEVFVPDLITDIDDNTQFGLLLDDNGRPLRFESPQVSTSNGFGLFDEPHPEEAFFGQTTGSFLQLNVQSRFDTPFGVLLEPALIGSTPSPRGTITTNPNIIEAGKEFALLNGSFRFIEQSFRDGPNPGDFGEEIENPARFDGFVTFDEKLANDNLIVFYVNGIDTTPYKGKAEAALLERRIQDSAFGNPLPSPKVKPILNPDRIDILDIHAVFEEKAIEKRLSQIETINRLLTRSNLAAFLRDFDSSRFESLSDTIEEIYIETILSSPNADTILNLFDSTGDKIMDNTSVIMVGYSEGSVIVNNAYSLFNSDSDKQHIRIHLVAPIASRIGDPQYIGSGFHVTDFQDIVINDLRRACIRSVKCLPPLGGTTQNFSSNDLFGHSFSKHYMKFGSLTETSILSNITILINELNLTRN